MNWTTWPILVILMFMQVVSLEAPRIGEAVDYLVAPHTPLPEPRDHDPKRSVGEIELDSRLIFVAVFGRQSIHLRRETQQAAEVADITHASGYVGKDSGRLPDEGLTEAEYVTGDVDESSTRLILDKDPSTRTGLDNAAHTADAMAAIRKEIKEARDKGIILPSIEQVFAITHPPQLRRLRGFLRYAMNQQGFEGMPLHGHHSSYPLNPMENPFDAFEVVSEITGMDAYGRAANPRLVDDELPSEEMVAYAREIRAKLQDAFDKAGIRNPSTADDTDQKRDWRRTAIFATPGVSGPKRGLAIVGNIRSLKQAKARAEAATAR